MKNNGCFRFVQCGAIRNDARPVLAGCAAPGEWSKREEFMKNRASRDRLAIWVLGGGSAVLMLSILMGLAGFRVNLTNSLPLGIYRVVPLRTASYVAFCMPNDAGRLSVARGYRPIGSCSEGGAPLLKQLVANPGDHVAVSAAGIAVNGVLLPNTQALNQDRAGRALRPWAFGDYVVAPGELWVASTSNRYSYDSRYYGPVNAQQVLGGLQSVLTF
jgi:conjugative transfer signal peptidase TraF